MEERGFQSVFSNLKFSENVTKQLQSVKVQTLKWHQKEKKLQIAFESEQVLEEEVLGCFEKELHQHFPELPDVSVCLQYRFPETLQCQEIIQCCWKNLKMDLCKDSPLCAAMLQDCTWKVEKEQLLIQVKSGAFYLSAKQLDTKLSQTIFMRTGRKVQVVFKDKPLTEEERIQKRKELEEVEANLIRRELEDRQRIEAIKAMEKDEKTAEKLENGIIIGKAITDTPLPILDSKTQGEKLTITGGIFNIDAREIKGDKYIVSFDITDKTDSTTAKFFIDKSAYDGKIGDVLQTGVYVKVRGEVCFDKYAREIVLMSKDISLAEAPEGRMDSAKEKRVELHLHTQMSSMDAVTPVSTYIKRAAQWGHSAIAVTDHGVVQAFPEAMEAAKKFGVKVLYGVEAYMVDDLGNVVLCPRGQSLLDTFVVFDIETTGLSKERDKITEIGAVKVENGKITDTFSTFVNPGRPLSPEITKLTGITDEMLADAKDIGQVLPEFLEFCQGAVLVAHNANFDVGFIQKNMEQLSLEALQATVLDTLELSRCLLPELKKHKLDIVAEHLGVSLEGHHRAVNDAQATAEIFIHFCQMLQEQGVSNVDKINVLASKTVNYKKLRPYHTIILVKNQEGLRNLYELVSLSHMEYFFRRPRIPKSQLMRLRKGLIVGSACEAGELYQALLDSKPKEYVESLVRFYDYLEIQPLSNNRFMIDSPKVPNVCSMEDIIAINKQIVALGESFQKPVAATCDTHFIDPEDGVYRKIIMSAEGFEDTDNQAELYFRTTEEMLQEFTYLGEKKAREVVITVPNQIAESIEAVKPIPDETFPPNIEGAEEDLKRITWEKAISIYGDPLPVIVKQRLDKELSSIIKNGFSVLYIIAQKLVWKSMEDGYLVGSRGSVGSSVAAYMAGITEVNALPPHYVCDKCKYSDFDSPEVEKAALEENCGCDMPEKRCPNCGSNLRKDGQNIPFETFLGFDGDKEPDIDLNFSGEYQQTAHAYTEELFGKGHVFKAGTIGTLADKTAYGFVMKYLEKKEKILHNAEVNRLVKGCTGVKRTTGQHPGGLMIVPGDHNIYEFCPIQRPANDMNSTVTTTHYDYHSISGRLLKLDLLGHDDPTVMHMLYEITGINPQTVSLGDKDTLSLFESPQALGVTAEQIHCETGTLGIPEFGTRFVRQMLLDTKPKTFSDLLRISGLSHGTDVWTNNAQELITSGTITLKETISTRDSIMIYLIGKGLPNKISFKIMEKVRKGKGLSEEDIEVMKEHNVPDWYIKSCLKIKYMFPKAHAAAYVMMAFRTAYYKINYPLAYYSSYFTVRARDDFDYSCMCVGAEKAEAAIRELKEKGNMMTAKEKSKMTVLEIIIEFYARGFHFAPMDLYESDAVAFQVVEKGLRPPFNSLQGLGINAAQSIVEGRKDGEFRTLEELKNRTSLGKSLIELLKENGVVKGIPETNQLTLF